MHHRGQKKYLERESFRTYSDMSLKMKISEQFDLSLKGDTSATQAIKTRQTELTSMLKQAG
jgi:hypothetical protein